MITRIRQAARTLLSGIFGRQTYGVAFVLSVLVHLGLLAMLSPRYESVQDMAISLEIVTGDDQQPMVPEAQGPRTVESDPLEDIPPTIPMPEPSQGTLVADTIDTDHTDDTAADTEAIDTARDTEFHEKDANDTASDTTGLPPDTDSGTDPDTDSDTQQVADTDTYTEAVAQAVDANPYTDSDTATDTGGGGANTESDKDTDPTGICLHDVFAYVDGTPSWITWMSMQAFSGTRFERPLAGILQSYHLYDQMVSPTEINPLTELEGVVISAQSFSDFRSYQVVTTYNLGEDALVSRLKKNMANRSGFSLNRHSQGATGIQRGGYRWDMVGSGRVMVASDAQRGKRNSEWPAQVTCMRPRPAFDGDPTSQFARLVRSHIGPSSEGRWPVVVMGTRDPVAAGVWRHSRLRKSFKWAVIKGYFSDPIRIEGIARFSGTPDDMRDVKEMVDHLLKQADALRYLGLGGLLRNIEHQIDKDTLHFSIPMTEAQVDVGLMLVRAYSRKLNSHLAPASDATP